MVRIHLLPTKIFLNILESLEPFFPVGSNCLPTCVTVNLQTVPQPNPATFSPSTPQQAKELEPPAKRVPSNRAPSSLRRNDSTSTNGLAVEIWLHSFSFLPLRSIIAARGVCQGWRRLVPLADIETNRRRLLNLFDTMLNSQCFPETPVPMAQDAREFNRDGYLDILLSQYHRIPDDFRLWILEWPVRMVLQSLSPRRPFRDCSNSDGNGHPGYGVNFSAIIPPQLWALIYEAEGPKQEFIPALLVWRSTDITTWLVFDGRIELFGRVVSLPSEATDRILPISCGGGTYKGSKDEDLPYQLVEGDWIAFLTNVWGCCTNPVRLGAHQALVARQIFPVAATHDMFLDLRCHEIPAIPWRRRAEPIGVVLPPLV